MHDFTQLLKTTILKHLPPGVGLWGDKAFIGIQDYIRDDTSIIIPHKKSPKGRLTHQQKQENKIIDLFVSRIMEMMTRVLQYIGVLPSKMSKNFPFRNIKKQFIFEV